MRHPSVLSTPLIILATLCITYLSSCNPQRDSRSMTQQEVSYSGFTAINANRGIDLEITQDPSYSVSVIAPRKYIDKIKIEQRDETLYITNDHKKGIPFIGSSDEHLTVRISMPYITQVNLAGAAEAIFLGTFEVPQFSAHLSGASEIEGLSIVAEDVTIEAYGASNVTGSVRATRGTIDLTGASELDLISEQINQLRMHLSGSSEAELRGQVTNLIVDLSGASEVDGEHLAVSDLEIAMAGASSAEIRNDKTLRYNLSGASKLVILGSPSVIDSKSDRISIFKMR